MVNFRADNCSNVFFIPYFEIFLSKLYLAEIASYYLFLSYA